MMALFAGTWVWATVVQYGCELNKPALDWADSGFGRGWALYILLQVNLYGRVTLDGHVGQFADSVVVH